MESMHNLNYSTTPKPEINYDVEAELPLSWQAGVVHIYIPYDVLPDEEDILIKQLFFNYYIACIASIVFTYTQQIYC